MYFLITLSLENKQGPWPLSAAGEEGALLAHFTVTSSWRINLRPSLSLPWMRSPSALLLHLHRRSRGPTAHRHLRGPLPPSLHKTSRSLLMFTPAPQRAPAPLSVCPSPATSSPLVKSVTRCFPGATVPVILQKLPDLLNTGLFFTLE